MIYDIKWDLLSEIVLRLLLWWLFLWLEYNDPFIREINENEIWKYQYPVTPSYIPAALLWLVITLFPVVFFTAEYVMTRKKEDPLAAILALTLSYTLNGFFTSFLKSIIGRPRPDFYFRCFPDGKGDDYTNCVGDRTSYMDGRKSFPSGHASFSFSCMFFFSLYLARKLDLFQSNKKGQSWQLCLCAIPIFFAVTTAASRTCDYHHHYEDVIAGSLLGSVISYLSFKLYFPNSNSISNGV